MIYEHVHYDNLTSMTYDGTAGSREMKDEAEGGVSAKCIRGMGITSRSGRMGVMGGEVVVRRWEGRPR